MNTQAQNRRLVRWCLFAALILVVAIVTQLITVKVARSQPYQQPQYYSPYVYQPAPTGYVHWQTYSTGPFGLVYWRRWHYAPVYQVPQQAQQQMPVTMRPTDQHNDQSGWGPLR